ncbi:GntR family transcriptional regulator [Bordetella tumulicola]|uniref:GntR family transcriptional regulator n=1 Tax=Bordetella tumulicola TaxID=1649133 RepID=UPI0039F05D7A
MQNAKGVNRIARPKLLVDEVIRAIRGMIVEGRVLPGERLSENALANELGVSTTPVREAIALLRKEGLVTVQPQSGTYVFELQPGELEQLCELRFALEPAAIQLALDDPQSGLAASLATIVKKMETAHSENRVQDYLALDTEFHETIIAAANNPYITSAYALISAKMAALRNRLGRDPHHMKKSKREHIEIANAIRERDLSKATRVLVSHIARKEGSYWEHLDPDNPQRLLNFTDTR